MEIWNITQPCNNKHTHSVPKGRQSDVLLGISIQLKTQRCPFLLSRHHPMLKFGFPESNLKQCTPYTIMKENKHKFEIKVCKYNHHMVKPEMQVSLPSLLQLYESKASVYDFSPSSLALQTLPSTSTVADQVVFQTASYQSLCCCCIQAFGSLPSL